MHKNVSQFKLFLHLLEGKDIFLDKYAINGKSGEFINFYQTVSSCEASAVLQVNVKVWLELK